ncbi:MAG: tetratricopeptide repeat protein [Deltaproteobacteria bacterium]|nr:tetratricopeptide repeat protein [Deltaproteobacteria bacterium]
MTDGIPDNLISRLSEYINSSTGLHFPREKWNDLRRIIRAAARDLGFDRADACIEWLLSDRLSQRHKEILIDHLTIGETFFFRDRSVFRTLRERILPAWHEAHSGAGDVIRFWSAGCCTGEEPYSIAMLIHETPLFRERRVSIIATDMNPRFIEKARKGIYTQWSFREIPDEILERYFKKRGKNRFEISPAIRKMVSFSVHNLIDGGPPQGLQEGREGYGKADIIFCRNALMYLSPDMRKRAIQQLMEHLQEGGWLILSPSESSFVREPDLTLVRFSGAILHRKGPPRKEDMAARASLPGGTDTLRHVGISVPVPDRITPSFPARTRMSGSRKKGLKREKRKEPKKDLYQEGMDLYRRGLYEEAAERLNRLLSNGGVRHDPLMAPEQMALLAKTYANMGRLGEAETWCKWAVKAEKLHPEFHYLLAAVYQEQGLLDKSISSLRHAIYLEPDMVMAYYLLGCLTRAQGKADLSEKYFRNALDLLSSMEPGEIVPYSDGLTAERLSKTLELNIDGRNLEMR